MVFGLPKIDGKDWHRWGAQSFLAGQEANGIWHYRKQPGPVGTALAPMFLKRANLARGREKPVPISERS